MPQQSSTHELGKESETKIAEQLNRILASRAFRQADRLKRFLAFIVEETLAGRGEQLKEFAVGVEVFGKPESFDPRNDPIVRVQARRLRAHLALYYREEGQADPLVLELPKGGYAPIFRAQRSATPEHPSPPPVASRNTVLVLPFADRSPAGILKHFCDGIREEILHTLMRASGLQLVAWEPSAALDSNRSNAALIITGSVRMDGDLARITTTLVDTATGCYLWSGSIDRKLESVFAIQEEVARAVADQLTPDVLGGRASRPTENLAAYNLYVQGRYHLNQRTEEALRRAVEFFERALIEDTQYAQAFSGLADAYSLLGHYGVVSPAEVRAKAAANAAWAVAQNDRSAEAHTSLAHIKATQDWDWLEAEREFQRAVALNSRYPTAHHWYAVSCLAPTGRLDQALEEIRVAQALDPISSIIARDIARVQYYRHDFDAALEQCDHTIELNPHFSQAYWTLGLVQEQRGDFDESEAAFQRALQLSPQSPIMQCALARTLALAGKQNHALEILKELQKLVAKRYVSPVELASVHFALAQTDLGFEWLVKAFQDRSFELITMRVDPRWQSVRGKPRFEHLLNQLGLP